MRPPTTPPQKRCKSLNGVRPRRPEQYADGGAGVDGQGGVSMESGLEDRNNQHAEIPQHPYFLSLNGVRPRRPEQSLWVAGIVPQLDPSQWSPA